MVGMLCYVGLLCLHLLSLLVMRQFLCLQICNIYLFYFEQVRTIYVVGFGYGSYGD